MKMKKMIMFALTVVLLVACAQQQKHPEASKNMSGNTNPVATITMENGDVMYVELFPDKAPNTVANFISLANNGFYDGLIFHRIIPGFMNQGGDPNGDGSGGPDYTIKGEFSNNGFTQNDLKHTKGVISMARTMMSMDSAGSQFFIMTADVPQLDGDYAAFGKLMDDKSMQVNQKLSQVPTNRDDAPLKKQVIKSIRVDTAGVDYGTPQKMGK